jgi:tubulin monoglycylase TTLL3/8
MNRSNEWRTYAKMEANHHLSNKYALFHNMNYYYLSIGCDPFEVLPLTFHVVKGVYDP